MNLIVDEHGEESAEFHSRPPRVSRSKKLERAWHTFTASLSFPFMLFCILSARAALLYYGMIFEACFMLVMSFGCLLFVKDFIQFIFHWCWYFWCREAVTVSRQGLKIERKIGWWQDQISIPADTVQSLYIKDDDRRWMSKGRKSITTYPIYRGDVRIQTHDKTFSCGLGLDQVQCYKLIEKADFYWNKDDEKSDRLSERDQKIIASSLDELYDESLEEGYDEDW